MLARLVLVQTVIILIICICLVSVSNFSEYYFDYYLCEAGQCCVAITARQTATRLSATAATKTATSQLLRVLQLAVQVER